MFNQYRTAPNEQRSSSESKKFLELIALVLDPSNGGKDDARGKYSFQYYHLGYVDSKPIFSHEDAKAFAAFLTEKGIPCKRSESQVGMQEFEYSLDFTTNKNTLIDALNKLFPSDTASTKPGIK